MDGRTTSHAESKYKCLTHDTNPYRFVVVCGDGEYIIYTALAWRNKSFGSALEFVWALDSNEYFLNRHTFCNRILIHYRYAIRESSSRVKLFKSFKEKNIAIRMGYAAEGIFGGALLGVRSSGFLCFYDWETGSCVRRIDVVAKNVIIEFNFTINYRANSHHDQRSSGLNLISSLLPAKNHSTFSNSIDLPSKRR
jgi:hypothetical protein